MSTHYQMTTSKCVILPYDIINVIFDYLSQITNGESGYSIKVNKYGKIQLLIRPCFTSIFDIISFKQTVTAKYIQLVVRQWTPHGEPAPEYTVTALEQPHRVHDQATIDKNYKNGVVNDNRCYTYYEPENGSRMIAYVESYIYRENGNIVFHQGCVYGENDESYVVSDFIPDYYSANKITRIVVNPFNMIWDFDGDDHWADNMEAAALLELEDALEEIDFEALPPLQIYM